MEADARAIRQFLERLHGPEPAGWLIVWTRQDRATRAFELARADELERAVEYCRERAEAADVYTAVGLQAAKPAKGRGHEQGVRSLPGFWADLDILSEAHRSKNLPPSEEAALNLIQAVGLRPSILVRSGFGLQPYWLFKEPLVMESEQERARVKSLSVRFQHLLRRLAQARGWAIDPTPDLCRVLRVPGTFNRKLSGDVRLVTAEYSDAAYCLDDFEAILAGLEDPVEGPSPRAARDLPPAKLPAILQGCAWMRHCRDDAATLAEPEWYRMLTVVARCQDAERWAHELSKPYPNYSHRETEQKLQQASRDKIAPVTCAYVASELHGERFCAECLFRGNINSPIAIGRLDSTDAEAEEAAPTVSKIEKFTDLGNARRFVARYRERVRYCERWAKWFVWDGMRWKEDETLEVFELATRLIRSLYAFAKRISDADEREAFLKHVIRSESWRSIRAMLNLAKTDPSVAIRPADLDRDAWVLTVQNGTLDLRTGQLRPHDPRDLISKLAPVEYDPRAECPNWMEFLYMVMNRRRSLVEFLQRAFGTCLTGITSDKAMFILYGTAGDNGKSTMIDVFQSLLGDYALRTPVDTFLRRKEGSIPNDVARLKAARFVWASENERGTRLSEALIKEMTGGDRMSARFMRGEFFEFYPEFKPWLATNHKPQIRGDQPLWRRLKLIPFDVSIPKEVQKPRHEVMAMFRAEFPGILNWAVQGCLEWQRNGLGVPQEVVEATREYEAEQDTFAMFLEETCVRVPNARVASLALYRAYKAWAEEHGESPVSHKMFASFLSERGFRRTRGRRGVVYEGVGLRAEDHYDMPRKPTAQTAPRPGDTHSFAHDEEGEEL